MQAVHKGTNLRANKALLWNPLLRHSDFKLPVCCRRASISNERERGRMENENPAVKTYFIQQTYEPLDQEVKRSNFVQNYFSYRLVREPVIQFRGTGKQ